MSGFSRTDDFNLIRGRLHFLHDPSVTLWLQERENSSDDNLCDFRDGRMGKTLKVLPTTAPHLFSNLDQQAGIEKPGVNILSRDPLAPSF